MTRRTPRGRGSVFYDPKRNRWAIDLRHEGRRYRAFAKSEAEAWEKRDELRAKANLGLEQRVPTLQAFITKEWLPSLTVRAKTAEGYRTHLANVLPTLGKTRVDRLQPADLRKLWAELLKQGLSPRTVSHARTILRGALRRAEQDGYVGRNVAALTDAPRIPNVERRTLSVAEAQRLLASLQGDRLEALYLVALTLGLRQSELFGLRWQDVETKSAAPQGRAAPVTEIRYALNTTIQVRQTLHRVAKKTLIEEPKTPRAKRSIPVPPDVVEALGRHRRNQVAEYLESGSRPSHDLVFTTQTGHALTSSTLRRDLYRRLDELGIERVTWHDLRHAAASLLVMRGLGPREIMSVLGHANFNMSMSTYATADAEVLAEKMRGVSWRQ